MTLRARNRLLFAVFIVGFSFIIVTVAVAVIATIKHTVAIPQTVSRLFSLPDSPFFFTPCFIVSVCAVTVLMLYASSMLGFVRFNFEKTQSPEIIFFTLFLAGCMLEGIRLWIPAFNLWRDFSNVYVGIGRFLFFSRMIASLSLIFIALLSINKNAHQDADKNCVLIAAAACLFAFIVPVDTITIPSNYAVRFGYEKLYMSLVWVCYITSFVAMRFQAQSLGSPEYRKASTGFIIMTAGYSLLIQTDALFLLVAGTVLLATGSTVFLRNLHKYYMWK